MLTLKQIYDLVSPYTPRFGYKFSKAVVINLTTEGELIDVQPSRLLELPNQPRSSNIATQFLWDKKSYLIGKHQSYFVELLKLSQLPQSEIIINWLNTDAAKEIITDDKQFYTFAVDDEILAQTENAIAFWQEYLFKDAPIEFCTVLGQELPSIQPFGSKIKGLQNSHSSGATLFASDKGNKRFPRLPLSNQAVFGIEQGLSFLVRDYSHAFVLFDCHFIFVETGSLNLRNFALKINDGILPKLDKSNKDKSIACIALKAIDKGNVAIIDSWQISYDDAIVNLEDWFSRTDIPNSFGGVRAGFSSLSYMFQKELINSVTFDYRQAIEIIRAMYLGENLSDLFLIKVNQFLAKNIYKNNQETAVSLINARISRQQKWKAKTNFENQDFRKGYKAGRLAVDRNSVRQQNNPKKTKNWNKGYAAGVKSKKN